MKNLDMAEFVAPIDRILEYKNLNTKFISIGDGGNELGMGKVN